MRHPVLAIVSLLAFVVGASPLLLFSSRAIEGGTIYIFLFNFLAWLFVGFLFHSKRRLILLIEDTIDSLGFSVEPDDLEKMLQRFLTESERQHRARKLFDVERNVSGRDLSHNLGKIVELAYRELNALSVSLTLLEERSGLSTQGIVIGAPTCATPQEMISDLSGSATSLLTVGSKELLRQRVIFAGTTFGTLWVELRPNVKPTKDDYQVLAALANQGALMLVDARFTNELLRMRRLSDESVRAKTGFLANLSHEIRGPLGIILNGVELVLDGLCGPITESQRETLSMIKGNGAHLLDLVNDVLDYAKVEAGKITAKPVDIRVSELLDDLLTVVRSQALAKRHQLLLDPVEEKLGIVCDKRHARQMLINFLTNSIKYTQDGGKITVKAERAPGNRIKITVTDTGVGIPHDQRDKVFSAFERIDDKYSQAQTGTGLGMPLTRRLAEVNQGMVDFESEEGKGSSFWLILPAIEMAELSASGSTDEDRKLQVPQGQGEQLLLVDHDNQSRQVLATFLSHQGFQVVSASSGSEVIRIIRENQIDLSIIENDLPDISGEDVVGVIRANPKASATPIVLLSAKAFVFDIERFLKLGVDRCLSKPVDLYELAVTARRLIDEARALNPVAQERSANGHTTAKPDDGESPSNKITTH